MIVLLIISTIIIIILSVIYNNKQQQIQRQQQRKPNKQEILKSEEFEFEFKRFKNRFSSNNEYGYIDNKIELELRNHHGSSGEGNTDDQFPKLKDIVYFDHAASTIASKNQLLEINQQLLNSIYCNPHSVNPIGLKTKESVDSIREMILNHFNAPYREYSVIFTSGCTDSLKKVGEYFKWNESSKYYYSVEAHNSLLGIREYACSKGASFQSISSLYFKNNSFTDILEIIENDQQGQDSQSYSLFGYPGQCNYSGSKYPLDLINKIQKKYSNVKVLLDAAALVGTCSLDLAKYPADFVTLSFYKMFGYPTGLGALIVKNKSAETCLEKVYFSGGTVNASMSQERFHVYRDSLVEKFEDGTINFMNIIALKSGFDILNKLGIDNIQAHTFSLTQYLKEEMGKLHHSSNVPLTIIYTDNHFKDRDKQGAIINFNVLRSNGEIVGYNEVEKLASLHSIYLRSGCFCNPGACHGYLNLTRDDIEQHIKEGHVCWDSKDILNGKPTGSLRISLGYMNNFNDAYKFIEFLKSNFINDHEKTRSVEVNEIGSGEQVVEEIELSEIYVYPVKSCAGFKVVNDKWQLVPSGLKYDREWTIIDQFGNYINQKKLPILATISTVVDLVNDRLMLVAPEMKMISIPLSYYPISAFDQIQVCGDKVDGLLYGDKDTEIDNVTEWLHQFTGKKCYLVRKSPDSHRKSKVDTTNEISFANESPYLLINEESVLDLKLKIIKDNPNSDPNDWNWITKHSFRANFIIKGGLPYQEDQWLQFQLLSSNNNNNGLIFNLVGDCNRCKMICINQKIGIEEREPLATLASYRRLNGKIIFGQHLNLNNDNNNTTNTNNPIFLNVPSKIKVLSEKY